MFTLLRSLSFMMMWLCVCVGVCCFLLCVCVGVCVCFLFFVCYVVVVGDVVYVRSVSVVVCCGGDVVVTGCYGYGRIVVAVVIGVGIGVVDVDVAQQR